MMISYVVNRVFVSNRLRCIAPSVMFLKYFKCDSADRDQANANYAGTDQAFL